MRRYGLKLFYITMFFIMLLSLVKIATTRSLQEGARSYQSNLFAVLRPIASPFMDVDLLEQQLTDSTEKIFEIPLIDSMLTALNKSEGTAYLGKLFRPSVEKYADMTIESILSDQNITYNPETGHYIDYEGK